MSARLIQMLATRQPRERLLLALLVFGVAPLALWLGVLAPLAEQRRATQTALQEAQALHQWVLERAQEKAALAPASAVQVADSLDPIGISGLEQSLISTGLRGAISTLSAQPNGTIELGFDSVPFVDLMDWLDASTAHWGYDIASFRLQATDRPAMILARFTLTPKTGPEGTGNSNDATR